MSDKIGGKAGFCFIWVGKRGLGDNLAPSYEDEVSFELGDYAEGTPGYLQIATIGVNYGHNQLSINGHDIQLLRSHKERLAMDGFAIPAGVLQKGTNTLKITARDQQGGTSGNVDDFTVKDPILFYVVA